MAVADRTINAIVDRWRDQPAVATDIQKLVADLLTTRRLLRDERARSRELLAQLGVRTSD